MLSKGLVGLDHNDLIIISDVDEIPNLNNLKFDEVENQIIIFKQKMFYYKLNLYYENFNWFGSKAVIKKKFISPQWLRNIKNKCYSKWRLDTYFSQKKYNNIKFIENGGWHFSYLKEATGIEKKLKSIRHHIEYDENPLGVKKIENLMKEKKLIYNYKADQRNQNKFQNNETLNKLETEKLPNFIQENIDKYQDWIE